MAKNKQDRQQKSTNEKPVSLNPIDFEDALRALLVTPPPKEDQNKKNQTVKRKKTS